MGRPKFDDEIDDLDVDDILDGIDDGFIGDELVEIPDESLDEYLERVENKNRKK